MTYSSIGVFDSGFGGLSILKEIVKVLPEYDYIYLGDTARAPYGNRSQEVIYEFTRQGVEFLFERGADLVILACNSASSEALRRIQVQMLKGVYKNKKVLGVIIPASEQAVVETRSLREGVLATSATVASGAFVREIHKLSSRVKVFQVPAPLLVPLIESGEDTSPYAEMIIKQYVDQVVSHQIDTLILGCTHYGLVKTLIQKYAPDILLLEEGPLVAQKLADYLQRHSRLAGLLSSGGRRVFYTTDTKGLFDRLGTRFFGSRIQSKKVNL